MDVNQKIAITVILVVLVILLYVSITWSLSQTDEGCGKTKSICDFVHLEAPLNLQVYPTAMSSDSWKASWVRVHKASSYEVTITTILGTTTETVATPFYNFTLTPEEAPPVSQITVKVVAKKIECGITSDPTVITSP